MITFFSAIILLLLVLFKLIKYTFRKQSAFAIGSILLTLLLLTYIVFSFWIWQYGSFETKELKQTFEVDIFRVYGLVSLVLPLGYIMLLIQKNYYKTQEDITSVIREIAKKNYFSKSTQSRSTIR
jgi:hypothetical protein